MWSACPRCDSSVQSVGPAPDMCPVCGWHPPSDGPDPTPHAEDAIQADAWLEVADAWAAAPRPATPPDRTVAWSLVAAAGALIVVVALGLVIDLDRDGISTLAELGGETKALDADSDGDTLPDGWEVDEGLSPSQADSDRDGRPDADEVAGGSDPRRRDTDGDGIPDGDEPDEDCDGDGYRAVASSDDDDDGIPDGEETLATRCLQDADGDGVRDGDEGRRVCIRRVDCDGDGLDDGDEAPAGFDALDPDTFDTGLLDGVAWAVAESGQPAGPDDDGDGIPDTWEETSGAIDWGAFQPQPGRRDLLVEFVRVMGPDSLVYASGLDFDDAYHAVAGLFAAEEDIHLQWRETIVSTPVDRRPAWIDSDPDHYLDVLASARYSGNPFVTSVVLSPQNEQADLGDILGAAFLRFMIATADYGVHTLIDFDFEGETVTLSPGMESHIASGDLDFVRALGFHDGYLEGDGRYVLVFDGDEETPPFTIEWQGEWFQTDPILYVEGGSFPLTFASIELLTAELASTIAHELGHTFGLCHAHDLGCYGDWPPAERAARHTSTMSYGSELDTLHFLPVEWSTVSETLTCAPEAPIVLVVEGAPLDDVLEAKYLPAEVGTSARPCTDRSPLAADLVPVLDRTRFAPPPSWAEVPAPAGPALIIAFFALAAVVVAGASAAPSVLRRRRA